jgi:hypothetical protein
MALDYLQGSENPAWSDALKCLVEWDSLKTFFPELVATIRRASQEAPTAETSVQLPKAIHYLSFIFSNSDLKNCILGDVDTIRELSNGLSDFLKLLLVKLNLQFDGMDSAGDHSIEIAEELADECYSQALELVVAVRVHLALHLLQLGEEAAFMDSVSQIASRIFVPISKGILTGYSKEALEPPNLCFLILQSVLTLVSDMLSLHVFDGDQFHELVTILSDAMDTGSDYGEKVKDLAYKCLMKVVISVAMDAPANGADHPAIDFLRRMVANADTQSASTVTKQLIANLVQQQLKKRSLPWLFEALSQLFAATADEGESQEGGDDDGDDEQASLSKSIHDVVKDAILKLS